MRLECINREVRKLRDKAEAALKPDDYSFETNQKMWGLNRLVSLTSSISKSMSLAEADLKYQESEFLCELMVTPCFYGEILAVISSEWHRLVISRKRAANHDVEDPTTASVSTEFSSSMQVAFSKAFQCRSK